MLISLILYIGLSTTQAMAATTTGNNFTMNNSTGGITGGTNDVVFTWDGTVHTPANSTTLPGSSNATMTSNEPFQAFLWFAHGVEILGTGPLGGTGAAASFGTDVDPLGKASLKGFIFQVDVPAGMIAAHMLFDWGARSPLIYCCKANCDIDLWNVYDAGKAYQGLLCGSDSGQAPGICGDYGQAATAITETTTTCHTTLPTAAIDGNPNVQAKLWQMVSADISGRVLDTDGVTVLIPLPTDSIPGIPFQDGPFAGFNGNFNFMFPCVDAATRCNDNNPCTTDSCDPTQNLPSGLCVHTSAADGTACATDNLICTNDICAGGTCTHPAVVCPGGATCDPVIGCNLCFDAATRCNDNNVCTTDTCDASTGNCIHTNNTLTCDDGNACTVNDTCSNGVCAGTTRDCNDNNACTADSCNSAIGCVNTVISCDDNNPCTTDTCDPATGCVHTSICPNDGDLVPPAGVDTADALFALRIAAGLETPTASDLTHGQVAPIVNGISTPGTRSDINMGDVLLILRKALGLETRF